MKRFTHISILSLTLGLLLMAVATGQESVQESGQQFDGTEFYVAFPPNAPDASNQFMGLVISSDFSTQGTIEIPEIPVSDLEPITSFITKPFSLQRGQVYYVSIPPALQPKFNNEASKRTVRVLSRAPVTVSVVSSNIGSSGTYPVPPVDQWGTSYVPTCLPEVSPKLVGITSQILLTAAEDETEVTIYPSARTTFYSVGERIRITLNRGETYLLQADTLVGENGRRDLSGTTINSSKPIGVVAGHARAGIGGDPDMFFNRQQFAGWLMSAQMPESSWGTQYFSVPMRQGGDRFRLLASTGNTVVTATFYDDNGNVAQQKEFALQYRGSYTDVFAPEGASLNVPVKWESNAPFTVVQLRTTAGEYANAKNSPAMIRLVPTSRYASNAVLGLPRSINQSGYGPYDLQLIAQGSGSNPFESISINGVPATDLTGVETKRIFGNTWRLRASVSPGSKEINAANGVTFTGHVSGYDTTASKASIAWEIPEWSPSDIERDLLAPTVAGVDQQGMGSSTTIQVEVTDKTDAYFSGVYSVELFDSPGWEQDPFSPPFDPDQNAFASFRVKPGVDPSGPLWLKLRDRDGNERTIKASDGICLKAAYLSEEEGTTAVITIIQRMSQGPAIVRINTNPCGNDATLIWAQFTANTEASPYLAEAPIIADNRSTPYLMPANDGIDITIKAADDLSGMENGDYVRHGNLELVFDDNTTYNIPIELHVNNVITGVHDGGAVAGELHMQLAPNPSNAGTTISFDQPLKQGARIDITDAQGAHVFTVEGMSGTTGIIWNGRNAEGSKVAPGVYFVTLKQDGTSTTKRLILVR